MPVSRVNFFSFLSVVISGPKLVSQASCASPPPATIGPYFAPYLKPGEIPDGVTIPLFHEVWTIMGSDLTNPNFTAQVNIAATQIFSEHFPTRAVGSSVGVAAPTYLDGQPVDPGLLANDTYSQQMLSAYNSLNVRVNITIDNQAWYPDLGSVGRANHNRLANKLQSEGFNVVAWVCSEYILEQPAIQILHRMPITKYKSYLVGLAVTGNNLVPMTLQKQNVVTAVIADVLTPSAVFYINCTAVNQVSAAPGSNSSTAVVSLVLQLDADAVYIGHALGNAINDSLGEALFDYKTAAAGLPMSAEIRYITNDPGNSITDQVAMGYQGQTGLKKWKMAVIAVVTVSGAALFIIAAVVLWARCQAKRPAQIVRCKSNSFRSLIEMQSHSSSPLPAPLKRSTAFLGGRIGNVLHSALAALQLSSPKPRHRLSSVESGHAMDDSAHATLASALDPEQVQICCDASGADIVLGTGGYGVVYKAKMGVLDVAIKTINRQHISPELNIAHALRVMQKELKILECLAYDENVVQFYGSYVRNGDVQLVLEYMEGGDLRHALGGAHRAALGWYNLGAKLALDVVKGLQFFHNHKILHRDIKSANVLLTGNFVSAKICDVGLAHIMGNTSYSSQSTQTTFTYAAPELLMGLRCDERADVFSLGVVLWELITQEPPRRGMLRDIMVPEECPAAVNEILLSCLDQEAARRPETCQIFDVIQASITANEAH